MSVVEEIREQQKKSLSTMSRREKFAYFWDYYKIHALVTVAVIVFAVTIIHQLVTNKDYAFYATFLNAGTVQYEDTTADKWSQEFLEYAQIDAGKYQVYIDAATSLSDNTDPQYLVANQQKLVAMMQTGTIHALTAETKTFEEYAQFECYYALEDILSPEQIEKYRPYFYYTDAATFEQDDAEDTTGQNTDTDSLPTDPSTLIINHRDPSTMEQPLAVGIILTDNPMMQEAGYYQYLEYPEYDYQGYPSDVVLGIPLSCKEPDMTVRFLEYLKVGEN